MVAKVGGYYFPVAYGIMPDKTEDSYFQLLNHIRREFHDFQPLYFHTDFDIALMNAVRRLWGARVTVLGCLFHLVHNLRSQLSEMGLVHLYDSNTGFNNQVILFGMV